MIFKQLKIKDIRKETSDCVSIAFHLPEELKETFAFKQGQNITVKMNVDGEEIRRSYSICSSPFEDELRIAVKRVSQGKFSNHVNLKLKNGDMLDVLPPTGNFFTTLHPSQSKTYLAFAAGSGITPVISIIKATLHVEPNSIFTLVYGNRSNGTVIFREELEGLKNKFMERFRIYYILSRENMDIPLYEGRVNANKCIEFNRLIDFNHCDEIFICGPGKMIFEITNFLTSKGIEKKRIHFELFQAPGWEAGGGRRESGVGRREAGGGRREAGGGSRESGGGRRESEVVNRFEGKTSKVTVRMDGTSVNFDLRYDTDSILEAALKQGLDLPYACKGGVCSTCRAKLINGKIEMDNNYALEPDEIASGFILTCQSHPRTESIIVDFDAK